MSVSFNPNSSNDSRCNNSSGTCKNSCNDKGIVDINSINIR